MKTVLVCVVLLATLCAGFHFSPKMRELAVECAKENKVSLAVFTADKPPDKKIFENRDYRCFSKCMAVKPGLVTEDGEIHYDTVREVFNATDDDVKNIKECAAENTQVDLCDRIYGIQDCIMTHMGI